MGLHFEYLGYSAFEVALAFFYQGRLDCFCGDWCKAYLFELVDVSACDDSCVMGLFEEVSAGDVYYQLAVLLYQLVGIADVTYYK